MSSTTFEECEADELGLPKRLLAFNLKKQPFHFMEDLNQKLSIPPSSQELELLRLPNGSKSEVFPDRSAPTLGKLHSYSENEAAMAERADPEASACAGKQTWRKKLTIQKKQSDSDPLQGKGVAKLKDGEVIFGTWVDGLLQGEANIVYPNGDIYCGETRENLKHGKGRYRFRDGNRYEGDFSRNHFTGFGVLYDRFGHILHQGVWSQGILIQNIY